MAKDGKRWSAAELRHTNGAFVRIGKLLYVRNGRLYGVKTVKGKMVRKVAPIQGLDAVDGRGNPTAAAKKWVRTWGDAVESADYFEARRAASVPTFRELLLAYERFAEVEFELNHTPRPKYVRNVLNVFKKVLRETGLTLDAKSTELTRERMDAFVAEALARGTKPISVFSYVSYMKSVYSRWAMERYATKGWEVTKPEVPRRRGRSLEKVYQRPPKELRERTLAWYHSLEKAKPMQWVAVALMLQFAMRNGDAVRLKWKNFTFEDGKWTLDYLPRKTKTSSGRRVHCAMDADFYERLRAAGGKGEFVLDDGTELYQEVNAAIRALGWGRPTYEKASYELRKMCVDQVYKTLGVEAAVQVSGDDIKTILRYYADPSRAYTESVNKVWG